LQECVVKNVRMPANCRMRNYTPVQTHGMRIILASEFSDYRILAHYLFTLGVPPTWRRGFMLTFNDATAPYV